MASEMLSPQITQSVDEIMSNAFTPDAPGATIIITRHGQTLFKAAYGLADLEHEVSITTDSVFQVASMTKEFTAIATLMLVEQGKINFTDTITEHVPYFDIGQDITIEQLLEHSSGIKEYLLSIWEKKISRQAYLDMQGVIDIFKDEPLDFPPGSKHNYSNSGYILLGALIENVSGLSFRDFLKKHIFTPLSMHNTDLTNYRRLTKNRARGYCKHQDGYINGEYIDMDLVHAAGAMQSTVDDLAKWDHALQNGRLIKPALLKQAWSPVFGEKQQNEPLLAWGFSTSTFKGHNLVGGGGRIDGFNCMDFRIAEQGLFIAILSNQDHLLTIAPALRCIAEVLEDPIVTPDAIELTEEQQKQYVGRYKVSDDMTREITLEQGKLCSQNPHQPKFVLRPIAQDKFTLEGDVVWNLVFLRDEKGTVTQVYSQGRDGLNATGPKGHRV